MSEAITFGRYRLTSLLGQGGMATVYRGVRAGPMGFEKPVAVKCIDPSVTEDEAMVRALINEARLGGRLRHPNIVEIYEFDQVEEHWYMAMEFVEGWTLHGMLQVCRKTRQWVPHTVALEILADLCKALTYAHGLKDENAAPLNLVHRDLKPGNVLVSRQGDVKLMDFGIAKAETNLYKTTAADATKGTPVYMSPEQVESQSLDKRSDLFSLGSMVHEMITLQVPFPGESLASVVRGILTTEIAELEERVARRIEAMGPVVGKLMSRDIDERYADARDVMVDVEAILAEIEGPTVAEWVEGLLEHLPPIREVGDFGRAGPPQAAGVTPAPTGLDSTVEMTKRQLQEEAPTRAAPAPRSRGPMLAVVGLALLGLGGAAAWGLSQGQDAEPVAALATPIPQATPTPQATPAPKPAPAKPAPAVAVAAPAKTPAPTRTPRPAAVAEATPEPTPKPAPAGKGTLKLNSVPWSNLFLDGESIGLTPNTLEVASGMHTVRFDCGGCDDKASRTFKLDVLPDQETVKTFRFE